ncbi:MAG: Xaa-Pro peptidase family protein, partial [Planctomycetota bacterium]
IRPRTTSLAAAVCDCARKQKVGSLGVESSDVTMALHEVLTTQLSATTIVGVSDVVEELREIKDKSEIEAIRRAVRLAEKSIGVIRASLTADQSELQIAANIEHEIRRFGGVGCSFPPIVAVGPRAALPHAPPTNREVGESDFTLIDWGAREQEQLYISDLTRVFVTGRISPKLERVYGIVLKAQKNAIKAVRPGVSMGVVDAAARNTIHKAGFGKQFGHGLGHGIGLDVHEAPRLIDKEERQLKPGMVITIEPGIYLPGWGGVRIEDDILVTKDGHEVLSSVPKELEDCVIG